MRPVLLRQTSQAQLTSEQAEHVVRGFGGARVLGRDGRTMLIDFDPCELEALRARLPGWVVSEQGPPAPVPDNCVHIEQKA